jgi:hypothetical protein
MVAIVPGTKRVQISYQKATSMVALARECPPVPTQRRCDERFFVERTCMLASPVVAAASLVKASSS